jgi:hypothetical protein
VAAVSDSWVTLELCSVWQAQEKVVMKI